MLTCTANSGVMFSVLMSICSPACAESICTHGLRGRFKSSTSGTERCFSSASGVGLKGEVTSAVIADSVSATDLGDEMGQDSKISISGTGEATFTMDSCTVSTTEKSIYNSYIFRG